MPMCTRGPGTGNTVTSLEEYRRQNKSTVVWLYEKENAKKSGYESDPCPDPDCHAFMLAKVNKDELICDSCGGTFLANTLIAVEA